MATAAANKCFHWKLTNNKNRTERYQKQINWKFRNN